MSEHTNIENIRREEWVSLYRRRNPEADQWAKGYGAIEHTVETQARVFAMAELLVSRRIQGDGVPFFDLLHALDRVTSAAMWVVVHETYARNVYLDGRGLTPEDFKRNPEGHTGGALNMVPAYAGYMAINAITGYTRSWIMGQGHCVAAIDTVNLLLNNMTPEHAERYSLTEEGLTRYVRDFYSYKIGEDGRQDSPLGSHVNAHTAGGLSEGGYLGFIELQYVHMPLPGERLVVFLSDGAFEEQRGSDWMIRLEARHKGMELSLDLVPRKPLVFHGKNGLSQKGPLEGQASYYFSYTDLEAKGFVRTPGSQTPIRINGISWFDHEFGSNQLAPDQIGWDWFSLHLSDGEDLMIYFLRRKDGTVELSSSGTLVTRLGDATHLKLSDIYVQVIDYWKSPKSGGKYPSRWKMKIPVAKIEMEINSLVPSQELLTEGSTGVIH
jgi:hypothetical protein